MAVGISNSGLICGQIWDGAYHGFMYDSNLEEFTLLDFPGAPGTQINHMNNLGQIAGRYWIDADISHGIVASPAADGVLGVVDDWLRRVLRSR